MFTDARLDGGKPFRIGGRAFIIIAHVDVHERGSGLEGLVRRIDLLGRCDRKRRVVFFSRDRAGNGDSDDDGLHGAFPLLGVVTARATRFETSRCREIVDRQEGHRPDTDDQRTLIDEELGAMVGGRLGRVLIAGRDAEIDEESRHGLRENGEVF